MANDMHSSMHPTATVYQSQALLLQTSCCRLWDFRCGYSSKCDGYGHCFPLCMSPSISWNRVVLCMWLHHTFSVAIAKFQVLYKTIFQWQPKIHGVWHYKWLAQSFHLRLFMHVWYKCQYNSPVYSDAYLATESEGAQHPLSKSWGSRVTLNKYHVHAVS